MTEMKQVWSLVYDSAPDMDGATLPIYLVTRDTLERAERDLFVMSQRWMGSSKASLRIETRFVSDWVAHDG